MFKLSLMAGASLLLLSSAASADPWKDESGRGRYESGGRYDDHRRWAYRVPQGHLPPPGLCRVWFRGVPPGQQPPPMRCNRAWRYAWRYGGELIRGPRW